MIDAKDIHKTFVRGDVENHVLKGITLHVDEGEFISIIGKSGAGKSTFMYQLSLLDHPTSGKVVVDGVDIETLSSRERTAFRLNKLGYIFQTYALLPELTATENVMVPLLMRGTRKADAADRAAETLEQVGLGHRLTNLPSQLSGGEQQRVSIARAIANKPKILFADEPTANLDSETSQTVIDVMKALHKDGQTIVMVTHEIEYAEQSQRIITLSDGKILSDKKTRSKKSVSKKI